jgi:hypothetical protein
MWNVRIVNCVPGSPIDCAANDTDRFTDLDEFSSRQISAVAANAGTATRFARQHRAIFTRSIPAA